jgi:hypothetical protein
MVSSGSNIGNTLNGINAAFVMGANPGQNTTAQAKTPTQQELRIQQRQEEERNANLATANQLIGGKLNQEVLGLAEQKLANAPSATKLAREGGGSLREQAADIPTAIASERNKFAILSAGLNQNRGAIEAEYGQLSEQLKQAQVDGTDTTLIQERMDQLTKSYQDLDVQGKKIQEDFDSNTTALVLRNQQIKDNLKAAAQKAIAFNKDMSNKIGAQNEKPVKVRKPDTSDVSGGDEG